MVPYTLGRPALTSGRNATLVLVLPHPHHHQTAHQFIEALNSHMVSGVCECTSSEYIKSFMVIQYIP